jgi:hypothetical protein
MKTILTALAIAASLVLVPTAMAQTKTPTPKPAPGQMTQTQAQSNPLAVIQAFTVGDLQAALADAQAQTPPDTISANCYQALIPIVQTNVQNPLPASLGAFQALQKARDIQTMITNVQATNGPLAPLVVACAPLILSVQNVIVGLGLKAGIIAGVGATGGLALPIALPALGGLGGL